MLGTIRLPNNLKMISETLPESNYDSDRDSKKSSATNQNQHKKYKPKFNHLGTRFVPGIELDEIKEVTEHEGNIYSNNQSAVVSQERAARKASHKRPKVIASNDAFNLNDESPRPSAMRVQISKVIPG